MCQNARSRQTRATHFFVKQLVNRQACLHLQREEALAVGERTVPCGENPPHSDIKKESLEWQMAPESHVLNFFPAGMLVILLFETIRAAPADVKMHTDTCDTYFSSCLNQQKTQIHPAQP